MRGEANELLSAPTLPTTMKMSLLATMRLVGDIGDAGWNREGGRNASGSGG